MIKLGYKPSFLRQYNKLESALQEETREKIELFKNRKNHKQLKVHKLKGKLEDRWSFSVNYSYRIVFRWESKSSVVLLAVGDHNIYS